MTVEVSGALVVAHELKAPLSLMRQLALSLDLATTETARVKIQAQLVETSERALRQVNDLTKIARLEDGLFMNEPVSVRGLCDEVLQELAPLLNYSFCQIKPHYKNKNKLVSANRDLLYSIVYNFCVNALHYANVGSLNSLTVTERKGKIRVQVRDFGPSLPVNVWKELQNGALSQPAAIAMRPGSSGLGLFIASEFAKHMQARLGAVRHKDGTSFFVDLNVSRQAGFWDMGAS